MTASGFLNLVGALGIHADSVFSVSFKNWLSFSFFWVGFFLVWMSICCRDLSGSSLCVLIRVLCVLVLQPFSRRNLLI